MNKLKSILAACFFIISTGVVLSQSGLTNLDFETTSAFTGMGCITPTPFPTGFNRSQACLNGSVWGTSYTLSPTAQSGTKYISINNLNTCGHVDLQPISFGMLGGNQPGNGSPYTNKPASFCGYYRTQGMQTATDSVFVLVYLTKNGALVGKGKFSANGNQSAWTNFCANITYYSALTPDTVRIRFTPSGLIAGNGTSFTSQTIYFDIDNCAFNGTVTSVHDMPTDKLTMAVYPNPANDKLVISSESNAAITAEFYNCLGQMEKSVVINSGKNTISTSDLNTGIYFIQYKLKDKLVSNSKVIISH